jgi:hypothetical protein
MLTADPVKSSLPSDHLLREWTVGGHAGKPLPMVGGAVSGRRTPGAVANDRASGSAPEAAPDATVESSPEAASDATPEAASDATPEAASDATPEVASDDPDPDADSGEHALASSTQTERGAAPGAPVESERS